MATASPILATEELAREAEHAGCRVLARSTLPDGGGRAWPVLELECGDNTHAITFLNRAASLDAGHPELRDFALRLRAAHPFAGDYLRSVHALVKSAVAFVREARETFQHALYTLRRRAGDCDDHARLVAALTRAVGLRATIVGVPNARGQVGHVAALVDDMGHFRWAETTVDARFGEHPRAAARRLRVAHRDDLWSESDHESKGGML